MSNLFHCGRRTGNPFNTTILPSPPASSPVSHAPSPELAPSPGDNVHGQILSPLPQSGREEEKSSSSKITWIAVGGLLVVLLLLLGLCLSIALCCKGRKSLEKIFKSNETGTYGNLTETHKKDDSSQNTLHKVPQGDVLLSAFCYCHVFHLMNE